MFYNLVLFVTQDKPTLGPVPQAIHYLPMNSQYTIARPSQKGYVEYNMFHAPYEQAVYD